MLPRKSKSTLIFPHVMWILIVNWNTTTGFNCFYFWCTWVFSACISVYNMSGACRGLRRDVRSPRTRLTDGCEPPWWYWESNLSLTSFFNHWTISPALNWLTDNETIKQMATLLLFLLRRYHQEGIRTWLRWESTCHTCMRTWVWTTGIKVLHGHASITSAYWCRDQGSLSSVVS